MLISRKLIKHCENFNKEHIKLKLDKCSQFIELKKGYNLLKSIEYGESIGKIFSIMMSQALTFHALMAGFL